MYTHSCIGKTAILSIRNILLMCGFNTVKACIDQLKTSTFFIPKNNFLLSSQSLSI